MLTADASHTQCSCWQISQVLQIVYEKLINFSFLRVRSDYKCSLRHRQQGKYEFLNFKFCKSSPPKNNHNLEEFGKCRWGEEVSIGNLWKIILNNSTSLDFPFCIGWKRRKIDKGKLISWKSSAQQRRTESFLREIYDFKFGELYTKIEDCFPRKVMRFGRGKNVGVIAPDMRSILQHDDLKFSSNFASSNFTSHSSPLLPSHSINNLIYLPISSIHRYDKFSRFSSNLDFLSSSCLFTIRA